MDKDKVINVEVDGRGVGPIGHIANVGDQLVKALLAVGCRVSRLNETNLTVKIKYTEINYLGSAVIIVPLVDLVDNLLLGGVAVLIHCPKCQFATILFHKKLAYLVLFTMWPCTQRGTGHRPRRPGRG